jgi:acyl transferase domain-containing protein
MARGNPDNLRAAAQHKRQAATQRAETALDALIASNEPITFRGLSKTAGVSIDFLYRSPLRARVERLRADQQHTPSVRQQREADQPPSQSNVVRALTAQITELKQRHRAETEHLQAALAAAQGENLELRRQLGRHGRTAAA